MPVLGEIIHLSRATEVTEIPSGIRGQLPPGTSVRVTQSFGGSYTVMSDYGLLYRVDAKDADALGLTPEAPPETTAAHDSEPLRDELVWDVLKTVYDPEIPVNIVDLGLIYDCKIVDAPEAGKKIDVKMTMTAPGCGMAGVLKADVENKLARLPDVKQVQVDVVFDPPWNPSRMSEAAKLQLGLDM
jgi:probable FeS assembly SUF system protein SufT